MNDILSKLTGEQALQVLERLASDNVGLARKIEEELQPFVDQAKRYHELGMLKQERDYCAGVILGLYRYEKESKSEFRNWSEDLPLDSAGCLRDEWRKRTADKAMCATMDSFIRDRCPDWAKHMIRESEIGSPIAKTSP